MKTSLFLIAILAICISTVETGCSRKTDAKGELEKAAAILEKPDAPVAAPSQQPAPSASPAPAPSVAETVQLATTPSQQMRAAIAAYKAGNLDDAVTRLQKLRATPAMSPEQRIALNDAMAAVMNEIYAQAAKGDTRAAAAVKQYEQLQTQRH
jgi:hypothetical protein